MRAHDHREIGNLILGAMCIAPDGRNVNNSTAGTIANDIVAKVFPDLFYKDSKGNTVVSQEGFNTAERMLPMTQTILPQVKIGVRFKKKTTQSNIQRPRSGDKDTYYGDYDLVNEAIDVMDNQAWTVDQDFIRNVDTLVQSVNEDGTTSLSDRGESKANVIGTKPTTVTPSGGSNIKTAPYLGSTINFKTSRNPFKNYKRHAILANMLKKQMIPGGNIPNYHQISAYDFDNRLGLPNPVSKSLATGYQYLSEAKKALTNPNYNFSDATSRAKEESRLNKMGIEGLSSKDMQNYQRALDYTNIDSLDDMRTFKAKYLADGGPARQNFKMGKRAFLKMLAGTGAGIVGLKSGLFGLGGKEVTKKAVTETVKSAGSGTPPPYFFKLVDKIKFMGDDVLATQDKAIAKKYKDYVLEEDFAGNISITRKGDMDAPGYEEVYMGYSVDDVPLKGKKGSTKVEEYEEYTVRPDGDGKMKDVEDGVPEDVLDDAGDPDSMTLKKASGGIARMLGE